MDDTAAASRRSARLLGHKIPDPICTAPKPKPKKRRNADTGSIDDEPSRRDKKPRVAEDEAASFEQRSSSELENMPMDILYEILGYLQPVDLLHLARTAKSFRKLLMTPNSTFLWKKARVNVPGDIPDCPWDLSEPQYAKLAFVKKHCDWCQTERMHEAFIVWSLRVVICSMCKDDHFDKLSNFKEMKYPEELIEVLPTCNEVLPNGINRENFCRKTHSVWTKRYVRMRNETKRAKWVVAKLASSKVFAEHTRLCKQWEKRHNKIMKMEAAQLLSLRKDKVIEYLKRIGWEDEMRMSLPGTQKPQDTYEVELACKQELTEEVLDKLAPFLNEFMEKAKRHRHEALFTKRIKIFNHVFRNHIRTLPANSFYPEAFDIFRNPAIHDIIYMSSDIELLESNFDVLVTSFPELILSWRSEVDQKLCAFIKDIKTLGIDLSRCENPLNLAIAGFTCSDCRSSTGSLKYPAVIMHPCARSHRLSYRSKYEGDEKLVEEWTMSASWNDYGSVSFDADYAKTMADIVRMCGLDPEITTTSEMEELRPIFECISCHDAHEGRCMMTWSRAEIHVRSESLRNVETVPKLKLVTGEEADRARARILEDQARSRASKQNFRYRPSMLCKVCKLVGDSVSLTKHSIEEHGLPLPLDSYMNETMVVPDLNACHVPEEHYLWPPRAMGDPELGIETQAN